MGAGTGFLVFAGAIAVSFFSFALTRAAKMREQGTLLGEVWWYIIGLLPILVVCVLWAAMGDQFVIAQRVISIVVGAAIGGAALFAVCEWIRPTTASAQPTAPAQAATPSVNIQGGNVILNFGTAKDITQNSETRALQAMRDPDGIYQFDQKVATVVAPEIDRSRSLVFFKQIQNAANFDRNRDFQYREYVLKIVDVSDQVTISGLGMPTNRGYANVQCRIVGIISP